jgi:hypothetical protein
MALMHQSPHPIVCVAESYIDRLQVRTFIAQMPYTAVCNLITIMEIQRLEQRTSAAQCCYTGDSDFSVVFEVNRLKLKTSKA